jgi:NADH-quinone oxidoreductase subunit J
MSITQIVFWFLSALAVFSALMLITRKNPVYSVLYLIITFFAISGHYILMNAQFLAIVNIIVYAGAIMVLFLFVLMLMNLNRESESKRKAIITWISAIFGGLLMVVLIDAFRGGAPINIDLGASEIGLIKNLGTVLYKDYIVPFELTSILFLSAMVGAIVLGKKH